MLENVNEFNKLFVSKYFNNTLDFKSSYMFQIICHFVPGDALVDGSTLSWDMFKALEGLSDEEVQNLTSTELDNLKAKALERNAWAVAEQVRLRVDDAKGPAGGYLHAYITEHPGKHHVQYSNRYFYRLYYCFREKKKDYEMWQKKVKY